MSAPSPPRITATLLSERPRKGAAMVAANSVLFVLFMTLLYWSDRFDLAARLPAIPARVFEHGEWWRLFTAMAIHSDIEHLVGNLPLFALLSFLLYGYFGPAVHPLGVIPAGALVNALSLLTYPATTRLVGVSGVIYLMAAFWLTLYALIDRRHSVAGRALRALGFAAVVLVPTSFQADVSYRTHAIGTAIGVIAGLVYYPLRRRAIRSHDVVARELPPDEDEILWN